MVDQREKKNILHVLSINSSHSCTVVKQTRWVHYSKCAKCLRRSEVGRVEHWGLKGMVETMQRFLVFGTVWVLAALCECCRFETWSGFSFLFFFGEDKSPQEDVRFPFPGKFSFAIQLTVQLYELDSSIHDECFRYLWEQHTRDGRQSSLVWWILNVPNFRREIFIL